MDESIDIVFGNCLDDALGSVDMNVGVGEVLGGIRATNEVVDNVGVTNAFLDGLGVSEVIFLGKLVANFQQLNATYNENDSSQITSRLQMPLGHLLPVGNNDRASLAG